MVENMRRVAADFPISLMVTNGMLLVGGLAPAMVQPVLEASLANRWIGRMTPAVRLVCEPGRTEQAGTTFMR
ncbi:MAG: hypothetical protein ACKPKO_12755, partial [Candidatus Fonsibacter sp.]